MESQSIAHLSKDRIHLEKISETIRSFRGAEDSLLFAQQMIRLGVTLSRFDRDSIRYPAIDENARDPTYFLAGYLDTKNLDDALWVYRVVRALTKYVLLSDKFYETGIDRYGILANRLLQCTNKDLLSSHETLHLRRSIGYWLTQFAAFWDYEQGMKRSMLSNHTFSFIEIREFNLSKSSDAPLVYARVLGAKLPTFNENVALLLHYNQALLDILDDWDDIEDDVQQNMPNVIVMAAVNDISYSAIRHCRRKKIRKVMLDQSQSSVGIILRLVDDYNAAIKNVAVPQNFEFLKMLSECYSDALRHTISVQMT